MPLANIIKRFGEMEQRRWAEWRPGKAPTTPQLAWVLGSFGLRTTTIRISAEPPTRYYRAAFEDARER
jgi:hypothetical protein